MFYMCFISRLFIYSMFYSFVHLSINGHGSVASWRSSRADVFFWSPGRLNNPSSIIFSISRHHHGFSQLLHERDAQLVVQLPPCVPQHRHPHLHQGDPLGGGRHGRAVKDGILRCHGLPVPFVVHRLVLCHLHLQVQHRHPA